MSDGEIGEFAAQVASGDLTRARTSVARAWREWRVPLGLVVLSIVPVSSRRLPLASSCEQWWRNPRAGTVRHSTGPRGRPYCRRYGIFSVGRAPVCSKSAPSKRALAPYRWPGRPPCGARDRSLRSLDDAHVPSTALRYCTALGIPHFRRNRNVRFARPEFHLHPKAKHRGASRVVSARLCSRHGRGDPSAHASALVAASARSASGYASATHGSCVVAQYSHRGVVHPRRFVHRQEQVSPTDHPACHHPAGGGGTSRQPNACVSCMYTHTGYIPLAALQSLCVLQASRAERQYCSHAKPPAQSAFVRQLPGLQVLAKGGVPQEQSASAPQSLSLRQVSIAPH